MTASHRRHDANRRSTPSDRSHPANAVRPRAGGAVAGPTSACSKVVVGLERGPRHDTVLRWAFDHACQTESPVVVVHVVTETPADRTADTPDDRQHREDLALAWAATTVDGVLLAGDFARLEPDVVVRVGDRAAALASAVRSPKLFVLGVDNGGGDRSVDAGTARRLMRISGRPVVLVPVARQHDERDQRGTP